MTISLTIKLTSTVSYQDIALDREAVHSIFSKYLVAITLLEKKLTYREINELTHFWAALV